MSSRYLSVLNTSDSVDVKGDTARRTKITLLVSLTCLNFINVLCVLTWIVLLMQVDFRIMCENAMIYNKPDTIYHKAARKLLHSGMKILSQVWNWRFRKRLVLWITAFCSCSVCCEEIMFPLFPVNQSHQHSQWNFLTSSMQIISLSVKAKKKFFQEHSFYFGFCVYDHYPVFIRISTLLLFLTTKARLDRSFNKMLLTTY